MYFSPAWFPGTTGQSNEELEPRPQLPDTGPAAGGCSPALHGRADTPWRGRQLPRRDSQQVQRSRKLGRTGRKPVTNRLWSFWLSGWKRATKDWQWWGKDKHDLHGHSCGKLDSHISNKLSFGKKWNWKSCILLRIYKNKHTAKIWQISRIPVFFSLIELAGMTSSAGHHTQIFYSYLPMVGPTIPTSVVECLRLALHLLIFIFYIFSLKYFNQVCESGVQKAF